MTDCPSTQISPTPTFINIFYVSPAYSKKHAHMIHKHNDTLELLYIADGSGRYQVGEREYAVKAGDLIICNTDILHGEAPFQEHEMTTYCLSFTQVREPGLPANTLLPEADIPVLALTESSQHLLAELMTSIYRLVHENDNWEEIYSHLALGAFRLAERAARSQQNHQTTVSRKHETLVRQITDYLNHHYAEPLTLKRISQDLFISETYLSHLFKRETGISPMQYVIHRRIGEAQSLLSETNIPISEIEDRLGFGSSTHFTIMFKKYVGIAPREYRKFFLSAPQK